MKKTTRCIIGIDAGGTKCDALVVAENGAALSFGRCAVGDPHSGRSWSGSGRSRGSIAHATRQAIQPVQCDELHVAAVTGALVVGDWHDKHFRRVILHDVTEYESLYGLTGDDCGVIALAGTGAFVHAKTRRGDEVHLDGLGPHLGDYGSGYQIGALALRAAAKADWSPRHATSLTRAIARKLWPGNPAADLPGELIAYMHMHNRDRGEVSIIAPIVDAEAGAGDRIARAILEQAASGLADTTRDAVEKLGTGDEDYPLICAGGVLAHSAIFRDHFLSRVREFAPRLRPVVPVLPAAAGVVLAVIGQMGLDAAAARETLVRTIGSVPVGGAGGNGNAHGSPTENRA